MICVYPADCTDFSTNGTLAPLSAEVTETMNGEYELTLVHSFFFTVRALDSVHGNLTTFHLLDTGNSGKRNIRGKITFEVAFSMPPHCYTRFPALKPHRRVYLKRQAHCYAGR